ncbi:hypothetical protein [Sodalis sp. dw_96]|uniref:hypothetical protein n=1 Tax=Sodalis sp. dw_96 TaxID=2719794 RepID=UPI001BD23FE4|nr:hypothetical protein [Sodalis sp. dw_96]
MPSRPVIFFAAVDPSAKSTGCWKKNEQDDYKTSGKKLHQASSLLQQEKNIHYPKQSNGNMRIKNIPQAITAGLYQYSALTSHGHYSEQLSHLKNNRADDKPYSAAPSSSALAATTEWSIRQLPHFDPNEHYLIAGDSDNPSSMVLLKEHRSHTTDSWLHYVVDPQDLAQMFSHPSTEPSDATRHAPLKGRSGHRRHIKNRPTGPNANAELIVSGAVSGQGKGSQNDGVERRTDKANKSNNHNIRAR